MQLSGPDTRPAAEFSAAAVTAVLSFPLSYLQLPWLEKFMATSESLIVAASLAELKMKVKGKVLNTVIVPCTAAALGYLKQIKKQFPRVKRVMAFHPADTDRERSKNIDVLSKAYGEGAILRDARKAFEEVQVKPRSLRAGDTLDNAYELLKPLGRGGFGVCFEAKHLHVPGVRYALKIIYRGEGQEERHRFNTELEAIQRYQQLAPECPNLLQILSVGWDQYNRWFYYVLPRASALKKL